MGRAPQSSSTLSLFVHIYYPAVPKKEAGPTESLARRSRVSKSYYDLQNASHTGLSIGGLIKQEYEQ